MDWSPSFALNGMTKFPRILEAKEERENKGDTDRSRSLGGLHL